MSCLIHLWVSISGKGVYSQQMLCNYLLLEQQNQCLVSSMCLVNSMLTLPSEAHADRPSTVRGSRLVWQTWAQISTPQLLSHDFDG